MAVWPYGGTPDSYVRDDDTLQLLPGARIVPLVPGTMTPVANDALRDGDGLVPDPSLGLVASLTGSWRFAVDGYPWIDLQATSSDGSVTVHYENIVSPAANVAVVDALLDAAALVDAAQDAAAQAAAAQIAAQAARAAAEAAAAGSGGGSIDPTANQSVSGLWTFSQPVTVGEPSSSGHAARLQDVTGIGTSSATANTVARRDSAGRMKVANPTAADDALNLGSGQALGDAAIVQGIARRKPSGALAVGSPTDDADAVPLAWAASHLLALPAVDATGGSAVPSGLAAGTVVLRQEVPDPAPAWSVSSETSSGTVPIAWTPPPNAIPGQLVVVVAVMAALGTWTMPVGASPLYTSTQGAGQTVMVYTVTLTEAMLGLAQQVTASSIPTNTRAKVTALGLDGVTASGATAPALTVQATATATPTITGTAASGPGVLLGLLVGWLTAAVADGPHWTWPAGWAELHDDAVATTSAVSTVSVTAATKVLDDAASAASAAPTSDLGATQYIAAQVFFPALDGGSSSGGGGSATAGAGSDEWLRTWGAEPLLMLRGAVDVNALGVVVGGSVVWPFGAGTGTFTGQPSNVDPRSLDGWSVTFVPAAGGATKTVTQPTMTRDASTGAVTNRPALTVA